MKYILNQREMQAVDRYSIEKIGIPSLVLMERAAAAVADCMKGCLKAGDKVLAVAGNGNNGADAVAAARILYNMGIDAAVYFVGDVKKFSPELKKQAEIITNLNMREYNNTEPDFSGYTWLIDGLFGIGLKRAVEGHFADVIRRMNESGACICAVDIPSGIDAGTGQVLGSCVRADKTVTFGYEKLGHILYPGCTYAGEVITADIGFARGALENSESKVCAFEPEDVGASLPQRSAYSNKGSYGRVLIAAGSKGMSGACYLSAAAAYRTGVGLVRILTCEENRTVLQQLLPEAIVTCYDGECPDKAQIAACVSWADTIVAGPGIGQSAGALTLLNTIFETSTVPVIMDADALNLLAMMLRGKESADGLISFLGRRCPVIMTPHLGEMSRLTGRDIKMISSDVLAACRKFAKRYQVICVLKDARTVTCTPDGFGYVNCSGNNGMATGGSGDVLSGIIGGLVCQQKDKSEEALGRTAALGAYIHGLCGDAAKNKCGLYGLLASDIIKYIPCIIR